MKWWILEKKAELERCKRLILNQKTQLIYLFSQKLSINFVKIIYMYISIISFFS